MAENTGRNVLFIVVFLATFTLLASQIPVIFLVPSIAEYDTLNVPSQSWYSLELGLSAGQYPIFDNDTFPINVEADLTLASVTVRGVFIDYGQGNELTLWRSHTIFWIFTGTDYLYLDGELGVQRKDAFDYMRNENVTSFTMKDSKFVYHVSIAYDQAKFDTLAEAWDGTVGDTAELYVFIGMTSTEADKLYAEATNAWNLVNQILFFQSPNIHPALNALIAIPVWISIAYLVVRIVLWIISAPLGGGGS